MQCKQRLISLFFVITCALLINRPSLAEPPNLSLLMQDVQTYHDSGIYDKELVNAIQQAQVYVLERAKLNANQSSQKKLAIVLDIDETCISNYQKIVARQFVGSLERIHRDIISGDAPAISPMLAFYNTALKQGISIFFITGRREVDRQITIKNLKQSGYHDWAELHLKPDDYKLPSVISFKSQERAKIIDQGYTIIANIGDQYSDLKGGYAEKTFKLPNPYYYLN